MNYDNWKCPYTLPNGKCKLSATLKKCSSEHCKSTKHNKHPAILKDNT